LSGGIWPQSPTWLANTESIARGAAGAVICAAAAMVSGAARRGERELSHTDGTASARGAEYQSVAAEPGQVGGAARGTADGVCIGGRAAARGVVAGDVRLHAD